MAGLTATCGWMTVAVGDVGGGGSGSIEELIGLRVVGMKPRFFPENVLCLLKALNIFLRALLFNSSLILSL